MTWMTVEEYCKKKGIKSPQTIYNKIYMNRMEKDVEWKEVDVIVKRKLIRYE